ncbi:MAG TPA: hypothetical protein VMU08_08550 [Rhizomicrobium sp.]|nr:hypothetical protein [Rhizomicrobium sp.]
MVTPAEVMRMAVGDIGCIAEGAIVEDEPGEAASAVTVKPSAAEMPAAAMIAARSIRERLFECDFLDDDMEFPFILEMKMNMPGNAEGWWNCLRTRHGGEAMPRDVRRQRLFVPANGAGDFALQNDRSQLRALA